MPGGKPGTCSQINGGGTLRCLAVISPKVPWKGYVPQPLVDDGAQSILVTGREGFAFYLLRRHICRGANHVVCCRACNYGDAKITEQDFIAFPYQHVLRFHVAVNQPLIMSVL